MVSARHAGAGRPGFLRVNSAVVVHGNSKLLLIPNLGTVAACSRAPE
jgi:hypothetical protein